MTAARSVPFGMALKYASTTDGVGLWPCSAFQLSRWLHAPTTATFFVGVSPSSPPPHAARTTLVSKMGPSTAMLPRVQAPVGVCSTFPTVGHLPVVGHGPRRHHGGGPLTL